MLGVMLLIKSSAFRSGETSYVIAVCVQSTSSKQYCQGSSPSLARPFHKKSLCKSRLGAGEVDRVMLYFARLSVHLSRVRKDEAECLSLLL